MLKSSSSFYLGKYRERLFGVTLAARQYVTDRRSSSYLSAGSTIAFYEISGYRDEEISFFCIYKRTIRKMLQFDQPMAKKFEGNFRRFE